MGSHLPETERMSTPGDPLAALLLGMSSGANLPVFPGYCQDATPGATVVQITGELTLTGLEYVGVAGSLVVGRVLLLTTPGAPLILGNLNA